MNDRAAVSKEVVSILKQAKENPGESIKIPYDPNNLTGADAGKPMLLTLLNNVDEDRVGDDESWLPRDEDIVKGAKEIRVKNISPKEVSEILMSPELAEKFAKKLGVEVSQLSNPITDGAGGSLFLKK